ncbi:MAG: Multi-sensor signal transduction histidine kinase [Pedosphaera sp.]|nr:Multi-sensor signal transduction histidine kinase [Pedosphaera sp.]
MAKSNESCGQRTGEGTRPTVEVLADGHHGLGRGRASNTLAPRMVENPKPGSFMPPHACWGGKPIAGEMILRKAVEGNSFLDYCGRMQTFQFMCGNMRFSKVRLNDFMQLTSGRWLARLPAALARYGFAVAVVLAALLLRFALSSSFGFRWPLSFFVASTFVAAWFGGAGPGVLALAAGLVLGNYYFVPALQAGNVHRPFDFVGSLGYVFASSICIAVVENLRRTKRQLIRLQRESLERGRVAESLRQSEKRFHELADAMPQMVWTAAPDGRLEYINQKWFEYTGLSGEQSYAQEGWITVVHPADKDKVLHTVHEALISGKPFQMESRIKNRDGAYRWYLSRGLSMQDESGRVVRWFATSTEIEEQKQTEQALENAREQLAQHARDLESRVVERTAKLEESLRSLEGVLYHVAHDLRAPLRAVEGFTQLLLERQAASFDPEEADYAARIISAASNMDELIRDLLDYGRLTHMEVPCWKIDLEGEIARVLVTLEREIKAKRAQIKVETPLPKVRANSEVLREVLVNILSNALKFVSPGVDPEIHIFARRDGGRARLSLQDNGIGIDAAHQEQIFQMFGRLHGGSHYSGTGIGLAIVRKGVERMGGAVGVESQPRHGSRFWVELPVAVETL